MGFVWYRYRHGVTALDSQLVHSLWIVGGVQEGSIITRIKQWHWDGRGK